MQHRLCEAKPFPNPRRLESGKSINALHQPVNLLLKQRKRKRYTMSLKDLLIGEPREVAMCPGNNP